jgi:hypothetical protein
MTLKHFCISTPIHKTKINYTQSHTEQSGGMDVLVVSVPQVPHNDHTSSKDQEVKTVPYWFASQSVVL